MKGTKGYIYTNVSDTNTVRHILYSQSLSAVDGHTQLRDGFATNTQDVPNIESNKDVVYVAGENAGGTIDETEKVGISVADNENESYMDVAAGSSVKATSISVHTDAGVQVDETPSLKYSIQAGGTSVDKPLAVGKLTAGMVAEFRDARGNRESYAGHSAVSGKFKFSKSMKIVGEK